MSTTDDNVCRTEGLIWKIDAFDFVILPANLTSKSALCKTSFMSNWCTGKCGHAGYRSNSRKFTNPLGWEVLDHPPYSPDLALSDFHLSGPLKKHLGVRQFATDGEVQQTVMSWFQALDTDFFYAGIYALVYRWDKCLGKYKDYVEK
jgi:hypothetical protein